MNDPYFVIESTMIRPIREIGVGLAPDDPSINRGTLADHMRYLEIEDRRLGMAELRQKHRIRIET